MIIKEKFFSKLKSQLKQKCEVMFGSGKCVAKFIEKYFYKQNLSHSALRSAAHSCPPHKNSDLTYH